MKKTIIIILILICVLALLPVAGNRLVSETLDSKIDTLKSNGVKTLNSSVDSKYLSTSRHYEFVVDDIDKFSEYFSRFSGGQLPPYTFELLRGTTVGVDLLYSNIPFTKALSLDIYPINLSDEIMNEIKSKDEIFYKQLKDFLAKKGFLYHIDYNIISEDFGGFVKDIEEKHTLSNNSEIFVDISGIEFSGNGTLIAPKYLKTDAKRLNVEISNTIENIEFSLGGFNSESNFESINNYDSQMKIKSLNINSKIKNPILVNLSNISVNLSSNINGIKAEIDSKSSFSDINITSSVFNFNASNFNYDISILDLDKDKLEEMRVLILKSQHNSQSPLLPLVRNSMVELLSKGFKLKIKDISLKNIKINGEDLKGFSVESSLNLKEDTQLSNKINYAPLFIAENLDFDFNLKVSDKLYSKLAYVQPLATFAKGYAKKSADDLLFDFALKNGEFKINGKSLKN